MKLTFTTSMMRAQIAVYDQRHSPLERFRNKPVLFTVSYMDRSKYPHPSTPFWRGGEQVYHGESFSAAWGWVVGLWDGKPQDTWPALPNKLAIRYGPVRLEDAPATYHRLLWWYVIRSDLEAYNQAHDTHWGQKEAISVA